MTSDNNYYHSVGTPWTFNLLAKSVSALCKPVPPNMRVLDVGCGNGFWANWFSEQGCHVVGIEPSAIGVEVARRMYRNVRFEQIEIHSTLLETLQTEPFDLVLSLEVVEHVYSTQDWANGCFAALRPGGKLICSTPYHGYLKNLAICLTNGFDKHVQPLRTGGHIKFFSRRTLARLLTDAGFKDIQFRGAGRISWFWKSMVMSGLKPLQQETDQPEALFVKK